MTAPPTDPKRRHLPLRSIAAIYIIGAMALAIPIILWFEAATSKAIFDQAINGISDTEAVMARQISGRTEAGRESISRFAALVSELKSSDSSDLSSEFEQIANRDTDGAIRSRREHYNAALEAGLWIPTHGEINDNWRDFFVRAQRLTTIYGRAALDREIVNTWILPKNKGEIIYWPSSPDFIYDAPADFDYLDSNWVKLVRPDNNKNGEPCWTPASFDAIPRVWLVSVIAPFYIDGEWAGSVGHDVPTDYLLEYVVSLKQTESAHTIVVNPEGHILVSGEKLTEPTGADSLEPTLELLADRPLRDLARKALDDFNKDPTEQQALFRESEHVVVATRIPGPGWIVLRVIPVASITEKATEPLRRLRLLFTTVLAFTLIFLVLTIRREFEGRRKAEARGERHETLIEQLIVHSPGLIAIKDMEGRYLFASESFAQMAGRHADEIIGRKDQDLFDPRRITAIEGAKNWDWSAGSHLPQEEVWETKDGQERTIVAIRFPLVGAEGQTFATGFIGTDLTEWRVLESRLNESEKMQAIGRLAGGIAHDFNNVTTAIIGFSELLESSFDKDDERLLDIQEIKNAGQRAADLSTQLLTFARRQDVEPQLVRVQDLLPDLHRMLEQLLGDNIELKTTIEPELPRIKIDPAQFQQLIINLAVNARDAMPHGGSLSIHASRVTEIHGDKVKIDVCDSGLGMNADVASRVFEPFFTTKGVGEGTGLGLATCYGVVQKAEGEISVKTTEGSGSTFTILLQSSDA